MTSNSGLTEGFLGKSAHEICEILVAGFDREANNIQMVGVDRQHHVNLIELLNISQRQDLLEIARKVYLIANCGVNRDEMGN